MIDTSNLPFFLAAAVLLVVIPGPSVFYIQVILLGCMFVAVAVVSDSLYALLAGGLGRCLQGRSGLMSGMRFFSGGVYIALGIGTALSGPGRGN